MAATAMFATATWAGGLMTNTNYHIAFDRMFARGASTEIDATFSNPAGLAWGHEGWQLSLNFQKPWQLGSQWHDWYRRKRWLRSV